MRRTGARIVGARLGPAAIVACVACGLCLVACGGSEGETSAAEETVSARSAPFQKYSGKGPAHLRIAEFGVEGSAGERGQVEGVVVAYLEASSSARWKRACRYLSGILSAQIEEISRKAKRSPPPTCAEVLRALVGSSNRRSGESQVRAPDGIASLRVKEGPGGGFALFHGGDGEDYWVTVNRQDGRWGVSSPTPEAFLSHR